MHFVFMRVRYGPSFRPSGFLALYSFRETIVEDVGFILRRISSPYYQSAFYVIAH